MMESCQECQRMLSEPVVVPDAFKQPREDHEAVQRQIHERSERDGVSHMKAAGDLFMEAWPCLSR